MGGSCLRAAFILVSRVMLVSPIVGLGKRTIIIHRPGLTQTGNRSLGVRALSEQTEDVDITHG